MNMIVSCYLTWKPDPQSGEQVSADDSKVSRWCESREAAGVRGLIFHDGLPIDLTCKWSAETNQSFIEIMSPDSLDSGMGLNEDRFFHYRNMLQTGADGLQDGRLVFTDLFDVHFGADPFQHIPTGALAVGSEPMTVANNGWMRKCHEYHYGRVLFPESPVYNAGIFGGDGPIVLDFLEKMCEEISGLPTGGREPNMAAFNKVVNEWDGPIITGYPLHSRFKGYEENTGAAIYHK